MRTATPQAGSIIYGNVAASAFVGREAELQLFYDSLRQALTGRGGLLLLTGEPGAGKTSLIEHGIDDLSRFAPHVRVVRAYCSEQYGADEPYEPFIEAFRQLLDTAERPRSVGAIARELAPHWLQAIPVAGSVIAAAAATASELRQRNHNGADRASLRDVAKQLAPYWLEAIPMAGGLLAAAASTAAELHAHSAAPALNRTASSQEGLFYQYTELFLAAAEAAPIVLVIDDLHWSDRGSVALLSHLTRSIAHSPVLIVGTYRPADVELTQHPIRDAHAELEGAGHARTICVSPLDRAAVAEFLETELHGDVADEVTDWLTRHTSGNPLFITHLTKWLVERGYIEERFGEWVLAWMPAELDIPRSAESVIEKRLTRLDADAYRILEYASVEGDQFHSTTVARLLGRSTDQLEGALTEIAATHQLVRPLNTHALPDGASTTLYSFSHTIVQDVLRNNLQPRRRILLHRRVAEVLEDTYAGERSAIAHRLAIHYDEGRVGERAFEFSLLAAEAAARVFAFGDAVDLLQRALRNAQSDSQRGGVYTRMGFGYRQMARLPDALVSYTEALDLVDAATAFGIRRDIVAVQRDLGNRPPAALLEDVRALEEDARMRGDVAELCRVLWLYRALPCESGAWRVARMREALQLATLAASEELIAKGNFELGYTLMLDENPHAAIPHLRAALTVHERTGEDPVSIGLCYNCLAVSHALLGNTHEAVELFGKAGAAFADARTPAHLASVRNNRAVLLIQEGQWDAAEKDLRESLKLAERMGAGARLLHPLENLGRLYQEKEDWPAAIEHWDALRARAAQVGYWTAEVIALSGMGTARLAQGDVAAARVARDAAEARLHKEEGWTESRVDWQLLAARIGIAEHDFERALRLLDEADAALSPRDRFRSAILNYHRAEALMPFSIEDALAALKVSLIAFPAQSEHPKRLRAAHILQQQQQQHN